MAMRHLDLNLLTTFEALVAEASVSRAARRLHRSQPAVSHALARLRDAFGDPILVRKGRTMEATPKALATLADVRAVLAQVERLLTQGAQFDPAAIDRCVQIGASDYATERVLAPAIEQARKLAPGLRVRVHHAGRAEAPRALSAGHLDLALGVFNAWSDDLHCQPLLEEPYVCAVARRPGQRVPRTERDYLSARHINVLVEGDTLGLIDEALAREGKARDIAVTVAHFSGAVTMVEQSDLMLTAPAGLLKPMAQSGRLRVGVPPVDLPLFRTQLAWSRRRDGDACLTWLRSCIGAAIDLRATAPGSTGS